MKITKRILVALLALSILVAGFAFAASAEDSPFSVAGIDEIEDVLEFYEYDVYVNNDLNYYDDEAATPVEETVDEVQSTVQIPGDAAAGYGVIFSDIADADYSVVDNMIFKFAVKFDENTKGNLVFDLKVKLVNAEGVADETYVSLLQIDMLSETPTFKYSVWDEAEGRFAPDTVVFEGVAPKVDTWYSVVAMVNGDNGTYNFSITEAGAQAAVESGDLSLGNKAGMEAFRVVGEFRNYTAEALSTTASFSTKDVEIYGGSFVKDIDNADANAVAILGDLARMYKENKAKGTDGVDVCIRIAEVFNLVDGYIEGGLEGVDIANLDESIDNIYNYSYANAFVLSVADINSEDTYEARREREAVINRYNGFLNIPDDAEEIPGLSAELLKSYKAAVEKFAVEAETLDAIQANSIAFIETLSDPEKFSADWKNFDEEIAPFYAMINEELFSDPAKAPDLTYADENIDMATVKEAWELFLAKIDFVTENVADFEKYVDIIDDKVKNKFGVRYYDGYLPATEAFNALEANEYFDVTTNAKLVAATATYQSYIAEMEGEAKKCEEFLDIVRSADLATYYTIRTQRLAQAAPYLKTVQNDYKGIVEAKALYDTILKSVEADVAKADDYITKVNFAVATLASEDATFAEKQEAYEAAAALSEDGNIFGYAGVKEANVNLSKVESRLAFLEGNSITLVNLAKEITAAKTLSERRTLIRLALVAAENCESSYEGVAAAKTTLDAAVKAFNAEVDTANGALASATENATVMASGAVLNAKVNETVAIIKDYID